MTAAELETRWQSIVRSVNAPYRTLRISAGCLPELYLALDPAGQRALILQVAAGVAVAPVDEQRENLRLMWHADTRYIIIGLRNLRFSDLFNDLTVSLYQKIGNTGDGQICANELLSAFRRWSEFFDDAAGGGLTEEELKGVFGELLMLRHLLLAHDGPVDTIVQAWRGPYGAAQDFQFSSRHIEVKTKDTDVPDVRISSEYQLQSVEGKDLHLLVINVLRTDNGLNISSLITEVRGLLTTRGGDVPLFLQTLARTGLRGAAHPYDAFRWLPEEGCLYNATEADFPKIASSSLQPGISGIRYRLSIAALRPFLLQTLSF